MKFLLVLLLIPTSYAFAESNSQIDSFYEIHSSIRNSQRTIIHDFTKLDFQILDAKKFFIPKWVDEPGDFSDILQVKFNVTNNGLENFVVYKNMFQIDVSRP